MSSITKSKNSSEIVVEVSNKSSEEELEVSLSEQEEITPEAPMDGASIEETSTQEEGTPEAPVEEAQAGEPSEVEEAISKKKNKALSMIKKSLLRVSSISKRKNGETPYRN